MIRYSIWQDARTGDFEIVLWKNRSPLVVQTGIKSKEKANVALLMWQQRERDNRNADIARRP